MRLFALIICVSVLCVLANAKIYLKEDFDAGWESRWSKGTAKEKDGAQGKFAHTGGEWPLGDAGAGLQTSEDHRFYQISAGFPSFSNKDKTAVFQFIVKFPQKIDCGGGYLKFGPAPVPGESFHGETPYNIMFGPDFCGPSTKKVHVIFSYKGKNHLIKKSISPKDDQLSHLYTLIVKPDNTYEVRIDDAEAATGKLTEDWDVLPAKEIKDPAQSKPADWVDEAEMDDPSDVKPADWDSIPRQISDPDAKKPGDWDDALDGEWEAPQIDNPAYKGEWKPKRIPNPKYKGAWVHPMIPNPEYHDDPHIYAYPDFSWVGVDVWQVKSGTIFDSILITDDLAEAKAHAQSHFLAHKDAEKKKFDEIEEVKKKAADASAPAEPDFDEDDHDEL